MRILSLVAVLFALGACSDDGGSEPPADAPASIDVMIDGPGGATCTGASYDPCTAATQCMSNNCHLFQQQSLQVCVPTCTPGDNSTCPVDKTGANGMCNNMGICRPAAANDCTR